MAVGENLPRKEGIAKLTGEARYVDDITLDGILYGQTVRSRIPRGRIRQIRFDPAFDWSRIVVATHRDVPGRNCIDLIESDQPLLAVDEVRHYAEPILLLAAETRALAAEAARHVQIEYDELDPVLSIEDALSTRQIIRAPDNLFKSFLIARGDLEAAFAASDLIIEGAYRVPHQEQLYIETQGMIAIPGDGEITVMGSLQCPYYVHKALKTIFGLSDDRVIVIQCATGGGFGGKEEYPSVIAAHAALLAFKAQRPVKLVYDRAEDIAATTKRHPGIIRHRTGVTRDGRLLGAEIDLVLDGGAYTTLSPVVLSRAALHALGPYRCENVRITARAVATNTPPNGAFRGFGAPQSAFAYEMQMERIAAALGLDPVEVRRGNLLREGDLTATGQRLTVSVGAEEVFNAALARADYATRRSEIEKENTGAETRRGIGVSLFFHGAGFTGSGETKIKARAGVEITPEGRARVLSSSTEIGQGTQTIFAQIVADELGLNYDDVEIAATDTSRVPDSGPTVASRTCMIVGRVLQLAAREIREKIIRFAAERHGAAEIALEAGRFVVRGRPLSSFAEVVAEYLRLHGALRSESRYASPPGLAWDDDRYIGDAYPCFSWGAEVVEVEVDLATCQTSVTRITTAQDLGRAIHPLLAAGQIEGGTLQAVGYGLLEKIVWDRGRVLNDRLTNYIIPTSLDAPEIETIIVEKEYPHGPFGAKGVGELPMNGAAPAIAAAILHATGAFLSEIPVTPEHLLEALETSAKLT